MADTSLNIVQRLEELKAVVKHQQEEIEEREADILRWSNVAYDLADAVWALTLDGRDGPKQYTEASHLPAPCHCLIHKAMDNWGEAQVALLNQINPDWMKDRYDS